MVLNKKLVTGGFFLGISSVLSQITSFVLYIILAKLLFAKDFGLIALATTFIGFISMIFSVGFGSAIIHFRKASKKEISTLYFLNFLIAVVTFLVVFLTAPLAADYYQNEAITTLIKWCSINILITPFFITHLKIFERDLEFKKMSKIIIISTILSALLSILSAYAGFGVYALVIQVLSLTVFKLIFTLFLSEWKPVLAFQLKKVKYMIWYAVKYRVSMGFLYFERNIDYLILGKFFSPTTLGYYSFSYNIMYTPVKRIADIFLNVLFPSLSSIKENSKQIIKIYFKSMQIIGMVSFPIMTIVSFNADWLVITVFGEKWVGAIPILQILCFAGAIQSVSQFGTVVLDSIGKPELSLYVSFIRGFITVAAILLGVQQGILVVATHILIAKILNWLVLLIFIRKNIPFKIGGLLNALKGVFFIFLCIVGFNFLWDYIFSSVWNGLYKTIVETLMAMLLTWSIYKETLKDIFSKLTSA